ncbi:MAG: serpin family protein [Oligoflexales bacterium]
MRLRNIVPTLLLYTPLATAAPNSECGLVPESNPESLASLSESYTNFALDLYRQVENTSTNTVLSPYSISTAIGMAYAGASGTTANEIKETLRLGLEGEEAQRAIGNLRRDINCRSDVKYALVTANAIWGQQGYGFNPEYLQNLDTYYASPLQVVDFQGAVEESRQKINAWVEERTNDKIKNLIPEGTLSPATAIVLTNAIYYKGAWVYPFVELETAERPFELKSGEKINVPTMTTEASFEYIDNEEVQAIELPIIAKEEGPTVDQSFLIVVPKKEGDFGSRFLKEDKIAEIRSKFDVQRIKLYAPKFKYTSTFSLAQTLRDMGMQTAFDANSADFSAMSLQGEAPIHLSEVIHKAFIDFNESGVEAAAATAITGETTSIPPEPITVEINRPFIFAIIDKTTNVILFMGQVSDPRVTE